MFQALNKHQQTPANKSSLTFYIYIIPKHRFINKQLNSHVVRIESRPSAPKPSGESQIMSRRLGASADVYRDLGRVRRGGAALRTAYEIPWVATVAPWTAWSWDIPTYGVYPAW